MIKRGSWLDRRMLFRWLGAVVFLILLLSLLCLTSRHRDKGISLPLSQTASPIAHLPDLPVSHKTSEDASTAPADDMPPTTASSTDTLPSAVSREPQIHIVIAHYSEAPYYIKAWTDNMRTMSYIQQLGIKVIIYTKQAGTDLAALKESSGAEEVVWLPNVGREGGTYLHHILSV